MDKKIPLIFGGILKFWIYNFNLPTEIESISINRNRKLRITSSITIIDCSGRFVDRCHFDYSLSWK